MKKIVIVLLLVLSSSSSFAQIFDSGESLKWANSSNIIEGNLIDDPDFESENINTISTYDFSKILMAKNYYIIGIIGENFQRIDIKYISIIKNINNPTVYFVYGKSKVRSNVCEFQGTIKIEKNYYQTRYINSNYLKEGFVIANCLFFENRNQKHSGYFKGVMKIYYSINKTKQIEYPNDGDTPYSNYNNGFVGTWTDYQTNKTKLAHWGSDFVPLSKDLNVSQAIGDFIPNEKYQKNGWTYTEDGWLTPTPKKWWE